jgi:AcrR family transcriptional regulator
MKDSKTPVTHGRRARRAEETRKNLMLAARELMASGGADSITIQSITKAADIGQGTFYNYFANRDEVIDAVILDEVESLGNRLDHLTAGMSDAAEIYAFSLRHLMHTAVTDPVWGWLVVRMGIAQQGLLNQLGPRASRDIQIGINSGRFNIADLEVATAMTFGSLLAVMRDYLRSDAKKDPSSAYAENLLRMVGLSAEEAREISIRPLPDLPAD